MHVATTFCKDMNSPLNPCAQIEMEMEGGGELVQSKQRAYNTIQLAG